MNSDIDAVRDAPSCATRGAIAPRQSTPVVIEVRLSACLGSDL